MVMYNLEEYIYIYTASDDLQEIKTTSSVEWNKLKFNIIRLIYFYCGIGKISIKFS